MYSFRMYIRISNINDIVRLKLRKQASKTICGQMRCKIQNLVI